MSKHIGPVQLNDGRSIEAEVSGVRPGGGIVFRLRRGGEILSEVALLYPEGGFGNGRVFLSSSQRLAVLVLQSGQSEEGYEVFEIGKKLKRIAFLNYQRGEEGSYIFSSDESVLVMALPVTGSEWWAPWENGEGEAESGGRLAWDFAHLSFHKVATDEISVHYLRVSVPKQGWEPDRKSYDPDLKPRLTNDNSVRLHLPWGDMALELPLPEYVTLRPDEVSFAPLLEQTTSLASALQAAILDMLTGRREYIAKMDRTGRGELPVTGIALELTPWEASVGLSLRLNSDSPGGGWRYESSEWKHSDFTEGFESPALEKAKTALSQLYARGKFLPFSRQETAHLCFLAGARALLDPAVAKLLFSLGIRAPEVRDQLVTGPFQYIVMDPDEILKANYCDVVVSSRVTNRLMKPESSTDQPKKRG